jgi:hypothetical protein
MTARWFQAAGSAGSGHLPCDPTKTTRSLCVALRLESAEASRRTFLQLFLCNDVDPAVVDQATCEAKGDRL